MQSDMPRIRSGFGLGVNRGLEVREECFGGGLIRMLCSLGRHSVRADFADTSQRITLQGDVYEGRADQVTATRRFSGGNLLGRWERTDERGRGFTIQGYLDRTRRDHPLTFAETRDTLDVVAQYNFEPLDDHRMLVGAGYRHSADETTPSAVLAFSPPSRDQSWKRLFAQDQLRLSTSVQATVALSIEHNPYTGTELLPNARVAWRRVSGLGLVPCALVCATAAR